MKCGSKRGLARRSIEGAFLLGVFLAAVPARADTGDHQSTYDPGQAQRRSEFAMGLTLGGAVGVATGYPNDPSKIGVPAYETSTGLGFGSAAGFWLGGALRDWFVFGIGLDLTSISRAGYQAGGSAFILHVEGYPLFNQGGVFRDLGVIGEFGAGGQQIRKGPEILADGGAMSFVQFGVVYEGVSLGRHFCGGPLVEVTQQFGQSLTMTTGVLGFRFTYYGGARSE